MTTENDNYWRATKHPWACVLFVLPLLAVYEIGLYVQGHARPEELRNGADAWLRSALDAVCVSPVYGAPCLLITVLLLWGVIQRQGRPTDRVGVWVGMVAESAGFALLLLGLSQGLWHVLLRMDNVLGQPNHRIAALLQVNGDTPESLWGQIVSYLGAGIYEETLFRLLIFAGLVKLFAWGDERRTIWAAAFAGFASALLFAGAHHLGPRGDEFSIYILSFRTFAGIYFAWLYQARGFGIVVGAHAGYDVLVGLILPH
jgi:hypothetical protein